MSKLLKVLFISLLLGVLAGCTKEVHNSRLELFHKVHLDYCENNNTLSKELLSGSNNFKYFEGKSTYFYKSKEVDFAVSLESDGCTTDAMLSLAPTLKS